MWLVVFNHSGSQIKVELLLGCLCWFGLHTGKVMRISLCEGWSRTFAFSFANGFCR